MPHPPKVRFCHKCGKRTRQNGEFCWFCNTSLIRTIRPPRHCDFCGEAISHKAKKCPHCGEYLDGRVSPEKNVASNQQVTFIIDKAVFGGNAPNTAVPDGSFQPVLVKGGGAVPAQVANLLSPQTVQAIESNQPRLIDQAGVRALPAPDAGAAPRMALSGPEPTGGATDPSSSAALIVRPDFSPAPPSFAVAEPLSPGNEYPVEAFDESRGRTRAIAFPAAVAPVAPAVPLPAAPPSPASPAVSAEPIRGDRYQTCPNCHTEILSTDNYCFHCGVIAPGSTAASRSRKRPRRDSNTVFYFFALLLMLALLVETGAGIIHFQIPLPSAHLIGGTIGAMCCSFLLLLAAFLRGDGLWNKVVALLLLLLWLLISASVAVFSPLYNVLF